ncbi:hypothetical protein BJV82DRAFT_605863 [Fennellomyces sp. T-0311]|nr:hypothetical protein BJV82DRAFT_605863 [Fennellomyces sp. T-0311]
MSDLNWCTYCDNAIEGHSNSLYCSDECLRSDALNHHPLLGYDYADLRDFPRRRPSSPCAALSSDDSSSISLLSPPPSPIYAVKNNERWISPPSLNLSEPSSPLPRKFYI